MIIGVEFDDVGAGRDLVADGADGFVDTRNFLRALRDGNAGLEALGSVSAARDDRLGRNQQARTGDDALVDRLLETDVGEARAFGAEVALGGEAGIERALGLDDGAGGAQRERLVQHLIVPQGLIVGMQEQVRMALDHAGHEGRARKVDRSSAGRRGEVRTGGGDVVAVDEDRPAFVGCGSMPSNTRAGRRSRIVRPRPELAARSGDQKSRDNARNACGPYARSRVRKMADGAGDCVRVNVSAIADVEP